MTRPAHLPGGVVGPNAITQLAGVLRERHGETVWRAVFHAAGLNHYLGVAPERMTAEQEAAALHRTVMTRCAEDWQDLSAEAGDRTARYLLAHRIPRAAQALMRHLPAAWAARLLVMAIGRNAWTFAGSGSFSGQVIARAAHLVITANPLAMPGCPWHRAVFQRLFRALVSPDAVVFHDTCCGRGEPGCRFMVRWS